MDLNYLLHRQQVERSRADHASCDEARTAHAQLAALYEDAIGKLTNGNISFLPSRDRALRGIGQMNFVALLASTRKPPSHDSTLKLEQAPRLKKILGRVDVQERV